VLIAVPRRFGKTSIMLNLRDYPKDGFDTFFMDTEWIKTPSDFIVEIATELMSKDKTRKIIASTRHIPKQIVDLLKSNVEELQFAEIKLRLRGELADNWDEKGKELLKLTGKSQNKMVFIVDEFPLMLKNMIDRDSDEAKSFLNWFRALRQSPHGLENLRFVVGGSIGIERLLNKINATAAINDLERISLDPFTDDEAREFIIELFGSENMAVSEELVDEILELIGVHIPYFIQVILSEILKESRNKRVDLSLDFVEKVYKDKVLGVDCRTYFEHYYERLRIYYDPQEEKGAKSILKAIAEGDKIKSDALYALYLRAISQNTDPDGFRYLMNDLENDFYVSFDTEDQTYSFSSKILKDWWLRHYSIVE